MRAADEYWATAVHESAHAVAALHEGLSLRFIEIGMERRLFRAVGTGRVRLCEPGYEHDVSGEGGPHEYDVHPDEMLVQALAAYPAEYRAIREMGYGRWRARSRVREATGADMTIASGYATYSVMSWRSAWSRAEAIVDENWALIVAVAEKVVDEGGYLPGLDVIHVVEHEWSVSAT